jgi:hypothetical protein
MKKTILFSVDEKTYYEIKKIALEKKMSLKDYFLNAIKKDLGVENGRKIY